MKVFFKKHVKDIVYIFMFLILFVLCITLFVTKDDGNNGQWREAYSYTIWDETYCIVSEDTWNNMDKSYHNSENGFKYGSKEILIKINNYKFQVKFIGWNDKTLEYEYDIRYLTSVVWK